MYTTCYYPYCTDDYYVYDYLSYVFIAMIALFTLYFIIFEVRRWRLNSLLSDGYYFLEITSYRRTRWIPVEPSNVDTTIPNQPRVINPSLVNQTCAC